MRNRLTLARIRAATATGGKRLHLWCADMPGFGCRITPAGARTFICRYRTGAGKDRVYTIGNADRLTVDAARDQARQVFAAVARGADPAADRQATRTAPTMGDVYARWNTDLAPSLKPRTVRSYRQAWDTHMARHWAALAAPALDLDRIARRHAAMRATPYMANRVLAFTSVLLNAAERWNMRPLRSNPCHLVERYPERRRGMVPEPTALPALWAAIDALEADTTQPERYRQQWAGYFRLLLLTGCRRSELLAARREHVLRERGVLVLPDTKTADGSPEYVELTPEALAVIDALPAIASPLLFPGKRAGRPLAPPYKEWQRVAAAAGMPGMRLHDLRHTVGTYAHAAGASQRAVAQLLRHKQLATTERYTHGLDTARRAAASATVAALRPKS